MILGIKCCLCVNCEYVHAGAEALHWLAHVCSGAELKFAKAFQLRLRLQFEVLLKGVSVPRS